MAWTDNLRPAKFRGASFKVESHDASGGRRAVKHEFPLRDTPYAEDMGRRAKEFSLDAYVVGDDYMQQRDALMRACDEAGSAELVHPYLGTLKVLCTGWALRESKSEGRMARFTLSFLESGEPESPSDSTDYAAQALFTYDEAKQVAMGAFADAFSIDGLPDFAVDDAIEIATNAAEAIGEVVQFVNEVRRDGIGPMIGRFVSALTGSGGLLGRPFELASSLFDIYHAVAGIFESDDDERGAIRGLSPMYSFAGGSGITPIQPTTSTRRSQQANRDALIGLVRQAAVIEVSRIAPVAEYETAEDAEEVRDQITDEVDEISEAPETPDEVYAVLQKVRAVVVGGVPPEGARLPDLVTITPAQTIPSLVLAYDTYEDAEREAEIVTRNNIKHPGFVPGAEPLRVLSNV